VITSKSECFSKLILMLAIMSIRKAIIAIDNCERMWSYFVCVEETRGLAGGYIRPDGGQKAEADHKEEGDTYGGL